MGQLEKIILNSLKNEPNQWTCEDGRFLINTAHGIRLVRPVASPSRWTFVLGEQLGYITMSRLADLRLRWMIRGTRLANSVRE